MKVAIVGATGETGRSVVDGLLKSDTSFDITALTRPSSVEKPGTRDLSGRGVQIIPIDLQGPQEALIKALTGIDVVISCIHFQSLSDEIPLSNAAKSANIKRYVPCFFATVAPRGVMYLRDAKEEILDHIHRIYLPYTVIDVGWWYQIALPKIPSGRFDYALASPRNTFFDDGKVHSSMTDIRDIGLYVAKIIADPQTLNRKVFAFTEAKTQTEIFELVEKVSGEKPEKIKTSKVEIESVLEDLRKTNTVDRKRAEYEYFNSWGIRGDNTAEHARYLGYLVAEDLYPQLKGRSLTTYVQEIIAGEAKKVYSG